MSGMIAGLGSRMLDSTSTKMVEQVVENFKSKLNEKAHG
jgi:carbon monoxide dehydrogenase subunit G